tara:strand:+ start:330 stop:512 length:183 start_codon:yes stop_codon:yes gene_type:complete
MTLKSNGRRMVSDFKKVGGYNYGIYYVESEVNKRLTVDACERLIELFKHEILNIKRRGGK